MTAVVTGVPVTGVPVDDGQVKYTFACAGAEVSYLVRSDGSCDRVKGMLEGKVVQRLPPPEKAKYMQVTAGLNASYLLRDDGQVDRVKGGDTGKITDTLTPADYPKVKYTAVSNSSDPCYFLRSDSKVDMYYSGKDITTLDGDFIALSGGTEDSYHLRTDGHVVRMNRGKVNATYPKPAASNYVSVASQCIMHQGQNGQGHLSAVYYLRADGRVGRHTGVDSSSVKIMECAQGYVAVSSAQDATYLLRADGAVDRTTGGGKIDNTMNPPPGCTYTQVSAGQYCSYFVRSDGAVDRTEGWGKINKTINPDSDPSKGDCIVM